MASRINILEMENVKLKEDYKKVTKHFGQKKALDEMSTSLQNVCVYVMDSWFLHILRLCFKTLTRIVYISIN